MAASPTPPTSAPTRCRPVIGIVGGIGSGKSEVARLLGALGAEVAHSDLAAREVLELPEVREQIADAFGAAIVRPDGSIDRAALARAIFADAAARRRLESIMHPRIEALRRAQFAAAPTATRAFVIDAPLLLEVGLDRECDEILFVDTPLAARQERVAVTRGWSHDELARRESVQLPLEQKRARATEVVQNDGDLSALRARVSASFERMLDRRAE